MVTTIIFLFRVLFCFNEKIKSYEFESYFDTIFFMMLIYYLFKVYLRTIAEILFISCPSLKLNFLCCRCVNHWNIPTSICSLAEPEPGCCCQVPKCPSYVVIQYPQGYGPEVCNPATWSHRFIWILYLKSYLNF